MSLRVLFIFCGFICSSPIWSFECYFTLAKDSCWTNYNVSVDVLDAISAKVLTTVEVPAGKSWTRQAFTCQTSQKLMYQARFTPVFWESDVGKVYPAERYWFMPGSINPGDTAWNIPVCFPSNFSQVPLPPDAKGNCSCDFSTIPDVKPK